jgi:hypothetical protein
VRGQKGARNPQAGLTLVELMVTMTLTTLLIGIVFTLLIQMSTGYRNQGKISALQQTLTAAQSVIVRDVRQAGLLVPDGFALPDGRYHQALEIDNHADRPDRFTVAYADPSAQAFVSGMGSNPTALTVDDASAFTAGDLAVIVDPIDPPPNVTPVPPQRFAACVVRIADAAGTTITLDDAAPFGSGTNAHCNAVAAEHATDNAPAADTMIYRFAYRAYRIDTTRPDLGVLQRSASGGLENDWEDLGVGFTDLQLASRWVAADGTKTWYDGDDQDAETAPSVLEPTEFPQEVTISFAVRTNQRVAGVVSDQTPALGDHPAEPLGTDNDRVYRWASFTVDLRNLGVAR